MNHRFWYGVLRWNNGINRGEQAMVTRTFESLPACEQAMRAIAAESRTKYTFIAVDEQEYGLFGDPLAARRAGAPSPHLL